MNKTLVCHHRDMDGWASAFSFWKKTHFDSEFAKEHGDVTYMDVQYGEPLPIDLADVQYTHMYVLDFSYDRETCDAVSKVLKLRVIDHHKSAFERLDGADYFTYDGSISGAELTWRTLHDDNIPLLIRYVGDYDLYKFELPESRPVSTYLNQLEWDFELWDNIDLDVAKRDGALLWGSIQRNAAFLVTRASTWDYLGIKAVAINSPIYYNEASQLALKDKDIPFVLSYRHDGKKWLIGLRGNKGYDLSAVASVLGGGGHRNAAGFTLRGNFEPAAVAKAVLSVFHAIYVGRMTGRQARQFGEMQLMLLGTVTLEPYNDFVMPEPPVTAEEIV